MSCLAGRITETLELFLQKMENSFSDNVALGYKQSSLSIQKVVGETFIEMDVCPQAGDTILDLGCGTGELSAYLADLVGPERKVVAVDPDKERILLAQQSYGDVKNLSFVEGSASNFPGIGSESYDIIFSNCVIHWIPDKQQVFRNMFQSVKDGGKIADPKLVSEERLKQFYPYASRDGKPPFDLKAGCKQESPFIARLVTVKQPEQKP